MTVFIQLYLLFKKLLEKLLFMCSSWFSSFNNLAV